MDEKMASEFLNDIDTEPLKEAIRNYMESAQKAIEEYLENVKSIYQAILDMMPSLSDVLSEFVTVCKEVLEKIQVEKKARQKWHIGKCKKIKPLLLDKRSKIHRCRNAC